jgi:hypothetical protein
MRIGGAFDAHDMNSFVAFLQGIDGVVVDRTAIRIDVSRRPPTAHGGQAAQH